MKLYSYVVRRDYGFAPNPFYGFCTLATCKPVLRRVANIGDWIIGTGSKERNHQGRIVFGMKVDEALTFNEYWADERFQQKKPFLLGSKKQAFGDNIYFCDGGTGQWHQENSHHSLSNGAPNTANISHDTQTDRILVGSDFVYWGGGGPEIPPHLSATLCKRGPGYKCDFPQDFIDEVIVWIQSQGELGYVGAPLDWVRTA